MSHLTLGWLSILDADPFEVVDAAGKGQFRSVSLRLTGRRRVDPFKQIIGHSSVLDELAVRLADSGLRLSNVSTYHLSPDVTLDLLEPVVEATARLTCDTILATCTDDDHARWLDFMARYCDVARKHGIRIALEFVPFSQAQSVRIAERLVAACGADNFGIVADALHLARSGGTPAELASVDPQRIFFAQICDAPAHAPRDGSLADEARTGRLYPGEGDLPLGDFLDALPPGLEIECEVPVAAHRGLTPAEQAVRAGRAVRAYLDRHFAARSRPNPYV